MTGNGPALNGISFREGVFYLTMMLDVLLLRTFITAKVTSYVSTILIRRFISEETVVFSVILLFCDGFLSCSNVWFSFSAQM